MGKKLTKKERDYLESRVWMHEQPQTAEEVLEQMKQDFKKERATGSISATWANVPYSIRKRIDPDWF